MPCQSMPARTDTKTTSALSTSLDKTAKTLATKRKTAHHTHHTHHTQAWMPYLAPPVPEHAYTYDKTLSSPFRRRRNADGEVRLAKDNVRPPDGFGPVTDALASDLDVDRSQQKYIYTIRHGRAHHNALTSEFTKAISWRFLGKLSDSFDPGLTSEGVCDALSAGRMLRELAREEGAPRPLVVYTSPLRRCVQTAMYAVKGMRPGRMVVLHVKEGLREWKGYDHDHQSDRRDVTPNIVGLFCALREELGLDVELRMDPGAQDAEDGSVMRETYVDVDRRVRGVLDDIFGGSSSSSSRGAAAGGGGGGAGGGVIEAGGAGGGADGAAGVAAAAAASAAAAGPACAMLVLHNRCNKSLLRVLGHEQAEVHKLNVENGAVLGYLMGRRALRDREARARDRREEDQSLRDRELAVGERAERHEQAARDVEQYRHVDKAKLRRLRDHLARGLDRRDPEAAKALADLCRLAPELKSPTSRKQMREDVC